MWKDHKQEKKIDLQRENMICPIYVSPSLHFSAYSKNTSIVWIHEWVIEELNLHKIYNYTAQRLFGMCMFYQHTPQLWNFSIDKIHKQYYNIF